MTDANSNPLAGKVALVSGGGQNIGRAIALGLAADGATVLVNGRGNVVAIEAVAAEINDAGGRAMAHLADVSDEGAVREMIARLVNEAGGIDIVVSNAGLRRQTPFMEMSFTEWREILSVALDGAFLLARHAAPHMKARGGGAIIGMSGVSNHAGTRERAHVNASKAGLEGLVRGLAVELAADNITVNAIAPGAIDTVRGAAAGVLPPGMAKTIPLGRRGTVDEIAAMVRHLVGPDGGYITGQCIHINGGIYLGH
ncbi:MAG: SDR family oxidoreductase [Alphaproteobacteria bacterium]|nr:SDR family oxidoreductase [Alphaproteobacteria bacterium]MBL6954677.1 SDR family oxidoreductase [Alphaproteobacteria bacterium]